MEATIRKIFVVGMTIVLLCLAIGWLRDSNILEILDDPGGRIPDNVPIPGR